MKTRSLFLLLTYTLCDSVGFCRAPSEVSSRRSSVQQEELLESIAAIKAAVAKIETSLEAETPVRSVSPVSPRSSDGASSAASDLQDRDVLVDVGITAEEVSALVSSAYSKANAIIQHVKPITFNPEKLSDITLAAQEVLLVLHPAQFLENALATHFMNLSDSAAQKRLIAMFNSALTEHQALVLTHGRNLKSKIYKTYIAQLKKTETELYDAAKVIISKLVYRNKNSEQEGSYYISKMGQGLINLFSQECMKLQLVRQYGVTNGKSLLLLDDKSMIVEGSTEDNVVKHTIDVLTQLSVGQVDVSSPTVLVKYMVLLKAGINIANMKNAYYGIDGDHVFEAQLNNGDFAINKAQEPAYICTEENLKRLNGVVGLSLKTALENSDLRPQKFPRLGPIRAMLKVQFDLAAVADVAEAAVSAEDQ